MSSTGPRGRSPSSSLKSSDIMKKYSSKSPSRISTAATRKNKAEEKKKRKEMLKLVDDAIEKGATDEAIEKERAARNGNWKTFEQHVEDAAVAAANRPKSKKKSKKKAEKESKKKNKKKRGDGNGNDNDSDEEKKRKEEKEQQEKEEREKERERKQQKERLQKEKEEKEEKERQEQEDRQERLRKEKEEKEEKERQKQEERQERLQKQEEEKERRLEQRKQEDPSFVERVPKRSALLAMGGKAAEAYKRRLEAQALALWTNGNTSPSSSSALRSSSASSSNPKWTIPKGQTFDGSLQVCCGSILQEKQILVASISQAIDQFEADPVTYLALYYPSEYHHQQQEPKSKSKIPVVFVLRAGTTVFRPRGLRDDGEGIFCIRQHLYQRLKPFEGDVLPEAFRDDYTDEMVFEGQRLHSHSDCSSSNNSDRDDTKKKKKKKGSKKRNDSNFDGQLQIPLMPGRGMGLADAPNAKLIGSSANTEEPNDACCECAAEPNDIVQGSIGNCWLLSAIACLADFDWAVKRLFRKTVATGSTPAATPAARLLERLPTDCNDDNDDDRDFDEQPRANQYVVTLWDLTSWKEVDIVIDERLPIRPPSNNSDKKSISNSSSLLGAKPSRDGKLWVPYLEKAVAIHCGGYDKLVGGNCTNAWPMLTGSRNQYVIQKNPATNNYSCGARFDTHTEEWSRHTNSPHDSDQSVWTVPWPRVGGGDGSEHEITADQLFDKIVAWDETNYLVGAGTDGRSDDENTDGIVDNHAYSVIDSRHDIGGTGIDLLLVRNPWGTGGGLQNGEFMTNGPGWSKYPEVRHELNPIPEDTGLFWVTKAEFFRYFPTIYLCKFNMTRLQDEHYSNDLDDEFQRKKKKKNKKQRADSTQAEPLPPLEPWFINKQSDPSSPYKILEQTYNGGVSYIELNKETVKGKSIPEGVEEFRAHPEKYLAIHFQTSMVDGGWPVEVHQYTFVYRDGSEGIDVDVPEDGSIGKRMILTNVLR